MRPEPDETHAVSMRVVYEVEMLAGLADRITRFRRLLQPALPNNDLARELLDEAGRNADIESFAIHARVLWYFLFGRKDTKDDVVALDFFDSADAWNDARIVEPEALAGIRSRVGRAVAHLTYRAAEELDDSWNTAAIWEAFAVVLERFFDRASADRLDDDARQHAQRILAARNTGRGPGGPLAPGDSFSSNATSVGQLTIPIQGGTVLAQTPWRDPFSS